MLEYPAWLINGAVAAEAKKWHTEKIIDDVVYDILQQRYPAFSAKERIITVLTIIGAVMIGLGSLLFIAAHWTQISTVYKLVLIAISISLSHCLGWWFQFGKGNQPKLGTALFIIGCFFYGNGIWLVSQIFNLSGDTALGLLLWALGTLAITLATGSSALAVLSSILIGSWAVTNTGSTWMASYNAQIVPSLLGFVVSLLLAYRLKSPWTLACTLASICIWFISCTSLSELAIVVLGITYFNCYVLNNKHLPVMATPYNYIGICITFFALLAFTYRSYEKIDFDAVHIGLLALLVTACLVSGGAALVKNKALKLELISASIGALAPIFILQITDDFWRLLLSNLLLLVLLVGLLCTAIGKMLSPWMINSSIFFLIIFMLCRYFDTFFSMMDRSLFFVLGGILLLLIGSLVERKRRQIMEVIKA